MEFSLGGRGEMNNKPKQKFMEEVTRWERKRVFHNSSS
jgi:hypothetical protein